MANPHPPLTWGQVKAWAEANGVADDAILCDDSYLSEAGQKIRDLSFWAAEFGQPAQFVLQHKWG